jgi:hypothetical protein
MTDHFLDPALPSLVTAEEPGEWRRDLSWAVRCLCGHLHSQHRDDLKTTSPCSTGGCGCQHLRPGAVVFYEHRTVEGRLVFPNHVTVPGRTLADDIARRAEETA